MDIITCYSCNRESKSLIPKLSCGHHLCNICLSHKLLLTEFKSITNEEVTFQCYCNMNGSLSINIKNIPEAFPFDSSIQKCLKHQLQSNDYCLDCKIWLCPECKKAFHNDYFSFHRLSTSEPIKPSKCLIHHFKIEKYCNECNRELCSICSIEDKPHCDSHIDMLSFLTSFKDNMMTRLNYKSYEEIERMVNGKEALFRNEIMNAYNQTKIKAEEIINTLKAYIEALNNQIEKESNYSIGLFHLIRYSYYHLYKSLNSFVMPVAVTRELNEIRRDVNEINVIRGEVKEIDNIVNSLWKLKGTVDSLVKVEIKYDVSKKNNEKQIEILDSGHTEFMSSICLIDNQTLVTGSVDHSIRLFNLNDTSANNVNDSSFSPSFTYMKSFTEHRGAIRTICLLKDGHTIATGGNDKTIKLWNLSLISSNPCITTLRGHSKCIRTIIQINDNHIASSGDDSKIMIWDLLSFICKNSLIGHQQPIFKLYLLKDSNQFASCSEDKTIKIWYNNNNDSGNNNKFTCIKTLAEHSKAVTCICQLKDERIVSGSKDCSIKIWDLKSFICKKSIIAHANWVNCIREIKSGVIATGGRDNVIKIWNMSSMQCLKVITGHTNTILDIIPLNENSNKIISGSCDKTLMIIKINELDIE